MQSVTLRKTAAFELISHGNGLAYTLHNFARNEVIFVQGADDAPQFREAWWVIERAQPHGATSDAALRLLWAEYEGAVTPSTTARTAKELTAEYNAAVAEAQAVFNRRTELARQTIEKARAEYAVEAELARKKFDAAHKALAHAAKELLP